MIQTIATILIFLFVILFSIRNMHQAQVNLPLAGNFEIRTIFLLLLCFFLGFATATFLWLGKKIKDRKSK